MKKLLVTVLAVVLAMSMVVGFTACGKKTNNETKYDLKVGAIMVGDETEGYTEAHMNGINAAVEQLKAEGKNVQVVWKKSVGENETCTAAINEFASSGCNIVLTNSYGHQFQFDNAWTKYPNVTFISMTGDLAASVGVDNYKNAFTKVFESRYVSGIVAGYKLQEMIDAGVLTSDNMTEGNYKIGYVGAYNYDEVVSGYTAFYLGLKSVVPNIVMDVQYTNSWFDYDAENSTAVALIAKGCCIIGQHADSEGAPTACENARKAGKQVYSVGYNVDMLEAAPTAALTSATNNWSVYYYEAFKTALTDGKQIPTNWAKGYSDNAVAITKINTSAFTNAAAVQTAVDTAIAEIKAGTLKVFNCANFTVGGQHLTTYIDNSQYGFGQEIISHEGNVYFVDESTKRSAPYFSIRIDGITEIAATAE